MGRTIYINNTYPTNTLAIAKKGEMRGLNKKEATADQSSVKAPIPRPRKPDPICWAVTDLGYAQHIQEMLCSVRKK